MVCVTETALKVDILPSDWQDQVLQLARERDAVILAHNYQLPEIQDIAHHTGDSLGLSRVAAEADASTSLGEARTAATLTLLGIGLAVLVVVSRPLRPWKIALAGAMAGLYGLVLVIPIARDFFQLDIPNTNTLGIAGAAIVAAAALIVAIPRVMPELRAVRSGVGRTPSS